MGRTFDGKGRKGKEKEKEKEKQGREGDQRTAYTWGSSAEWIGGWRAGVKARKKAFMNRETNEREVQASIDHFAATFLSYQYSYTYGRFSEQRRGGGSAG
jgi:hypothetical protein